MARVRVCPRCGHINALSRNGMPIMNCLGDFGGMPCDESLSDVSPTEAEAADENSTDRSDRTNRAQSRQQATHDTAGQNRYATYALEFPWGVVPIAGFLSIGRDPAFSAIANEIQRIDTTESVSRKHAILSVSPQGELQVHDVGSTNASFVNGEEIPPGKPIGVCEGDELSFSSSLKAIVQRAG